MKKQLSLYPDTFISLKGDNGLMYNSKHFSAFEFHVSSEIRQLCNGLLLPSNLYTVPIHASAISQAADSFIQNIISHRCGTLVSESTPVVSFPPFLNIQKDIAKISKDKNRGAGEDLLKYFSSLTIQTGGIYKENNYYKQTIYPVNSRTILPVALLKKILHEYDTPYLSRINLVINSPEQIVIYKETLETLRQSGKSVYVYLPAEKITLDGISRMTSHKVQIKLIQDDPQTIPETSFINHPNISYVFIIRNNTEYRRYSELVLKYPLGHHEMIPIFENNLAFFKKQVFLTKEDLLKSTLCRREVFAHQAVNTNFFGNLIIMPDKKVYSNLNTPALGDISESIYDLILLELQQNHAWRMVRDKKPCVDCVWQWICPSPSNYELVMNTSNMCTV